MRRPYGPLSGCGMHWIKVRLASFRKYKPLLGQLVLRDIKLKYRRSFLGYLWSVLNPLLIMLVMSVVFLQLFQNDIPYFPVYLLTGQILFTFMTESTNFAILSITGNSALIKKTYIPKYIFTLSKVTSSLVNLAFSSVALWIVVFITGVPLTLHALLFPLVFVELYIFCLGLGLFLAQAAVFFRDIQYIYGVVTTAWTYMTPVFYPASLMSQGLRVWILRLNPMYYYIAQFRDMVLYGRMPSLALAGGGVLFALLFLGLGLWSFRRAQDKFILYI